MQHRLTRKRPGIRQPPEETAPPVPSDHEDEPLTELTPAPAGGTLRKLWAGDRHDFRDHLLRLDTAGRHARFAMAASDDFVAAYAARSFHLDTVIHGWFEDGVLRAAGELRLIGG